MPAQYARFDQWPLDRNVQAAGGGEALYDRREVDPERQDQVQARVGSERQARRAPALGIISEGDTALWRASETLAGASAFTVGFSLMVGDITEATGTYPLCMLRANASDSDRFFVYLERTASDLQLVVLAEGATSSATGTITGVTPDSDLDLAFRFDGSTVTLDDGTSQASVAVAGLGAFTGPYIVEVLGTALTSYGSKPEAKHPVVSNLALAAAHEATLANILGVRDPSWADDYWRLDGDAEAGIIAADTGSAHLYAQPGAPQIVGGSLRFSGLSGRLQVRHTADFDRYFQTRLRSSGETELTFMVTGTRSRDTQEEVLLDYGELGVIKFKADDTVEYTFNEQTVTSVGTVAAGASFTIFCGRKDADTIFVELDDETPVTTAPSGGLNSPFLDFSRLPSFYVGGAEDVDLGTEYEGTVDKVALFPFDTRRDPGPSGASVYFDAAEGLEDQSLNGVTLALTTHSDAEGTPTYAPGALDDAAFVGIEGGAALAESGPLSHTTRIARRVADDFAASRLGHLTFVTSSGHVHVINSDRDRMRTLGIPVPGRVASTSAISPGVLDGAYAYGYRYVTYDGTAGPILRLDPVEATQGSKVIVGSSLDADDPGGSELGETYGRCYAGSADRFSASTNVSGLTAGETYTISDYFRLPNWDEDDFKEQVYHRGVRNRDTDNRTRFQTQLDNHSIDTSGNWTIQHTFRFQSAPTVTDGRRAQGLLGIGENSNLWPAHGGNVDFTTRNSDVAAYITEGHDTIPDIYGSASVPRLVVVIGRARTRTMYFATPRSDNYISANYFSLSFKEDAGGPGQLTWTPGTDYSLYLIRTGDELKVYVYDITNDVWYTLADSAAGVVSNTMTGYVSGQRGPGGTVPSKPNYTAADYFKDWSPFSEKREPFFGSGNNPVIEAPFLLASTEDVDHTDWLQYTIDHVGFDSAWVVVPPQPGGTIFWHSRIWTRAWSQAILERYALDRYAAIPGEPLEVEIFADLGYVLERQDSLADKIQDRSLSMPWKVRGETAGSSQSVEYIVPGGALDAPKHAILALESGIATKLEDAAIRVFYSAFGDGRLTIATEEEGEYAITRRIWDAPSTNPQFVKTIEEVRSTGVSLNDWDNFNWFSYELAVESSAAGGTTRAVGINAVAVNGNTVFDLPIGSLDISARIGSWNSDWIHIAGTPNNQVIDETVDTGEFRLWDADQGPDVEDGEGFDFLTGRVSENELSNLLVYFKFQPDDIVPSSGNLKNYGSEGSDSDALLWGTAEIVDDRQTSGGGGDPQPVVAFPGQPAEHVIALEIVRTATVPINDPNSEDEAQTALNAARGLPLFSLARVPIGTTHYVDNTPDSALGDQVDEASGYLPRDIVSAFTWQGRVVILDEDNRLWPSERGAFGWESFPSPFRLPSSVAAGPARGGIEVQGQFGEGLAMVTGRSWAVLLGGTADAPEIRNLGGGVGAESQACMAAYSGIGFAYNGTLWAVAQGQAVDFGQPVQSLLPAAADCRLAISARLASLFVIDTSSGDCLRYHFPTQRWSVEERDAAAMGDLDDGTDAWAMQHGSWAKGDTSVYGDDVDALTPGSETGTISADTVNLDSAATVPQGVRCLVVDSSGTETTARTASDLAAGTALAFASGALAGLSGACTVYFGTGPTGLMLDTGPIDLGSEGYLARFGIDTESGDGWEFAVYASQTPLARSRPSGLEWTALTTTEAGDRDAGVRGRFSRAAVRNRTRQAATLTLAEMGVN